MVDVTPLAHVIPMILVTLLPSVIPLAHVTLMPMLYQWLALFVSSVFQPDTFSEIIEPILSCWLA